MNITWINQSILFASAAETSSKMSLDLYEHLKVVGKGSYGEVWLVRNKKDKKQVSSISYIKRNICPGKCWAVLKAWNHSFRTILNEEDLGFGLLYCGLTLEFVLIVSLDVDVINHLYIISFKFFLCQNQYWTEHLIFSVPVTVYVDHIEEK